MPSAEFDGLYSKVGRPSIAPETLLRALLLQAFYSIRSERQLMEQMDDNLLLRWFVGLSMDAEIWDAAVFTKNPDRLLSGDVAAKFLAAVVAQARSRSLLSDDHFSVDGALIEAWASIKSFRPKAGSGEPPGAGRNGERDFHGEKRSNKTHASTTDPEAKLYRKADGQPSRIAFMGHVLMENRNGLIVGATLTPSTGTAEREAALALVDRLGSKRRITLAADKAYDAREFVAALRKRKVTPHIAKHEYVDKNGVKRPSALDGRTTRHAGYEISLRVRKRIEEAFGWIKTTGRLRKTHHRGTARADWMFTLTVAAYNLVRLPMLAATAQHYRCIFRLM